jgi:hypothetical protein
MSLTFRDAPSFWKETLAVTGGAVAAGVAVGVTAPMTGLPLVALAGAAALFGGALGAAAAKPKRSLMRGLFGVAAAAAMALGFVGLAHVLDAGDVGTILGGWAGGLALGGLLGREDKLGAGSRVAGLLASSTTGAVGALALTKIAAYSVSESAPVAITAATMAGVLGLWIAAAAGLRRIEKVRDPLLAKADEVLEGCADPVRTKVVECLEAWTEIDEGIAKTENMAKEMGDEARKQARTLVESMLECAQTWKQIHADLSSPRLRGIEDKLADLEKRAASTTDAVTVGHLERAAQALRAQKSAIDGLKVGTGRAEAALDAQQALLERLRLAVAQHRVSDRERFAVEVSAIADQTAKLSDDLESISAAIAEAEALADRRVLADLERAGRRALSQLDTGDENSAVKSEEKIEVTR